MNFLDPRLIDTFETNDESQPLQEPADMAPQTFDSDLPLADFMVDYNEFLLPTWSDPPAPDSDYPDPSPEFAYPEAPLTGNPVCQHCLRPFDSPAPDRPDYPDVPFEDYLIIPEQSDQIPSPLQYPMEAEQEVGQSDQQLSPLQYPVEPEQNEHSSPVLRLGTPIPTDQSMTAGSSRPVANTDGFDPPDNGGEVEYRNDDGAEQSPPLRRQRLKSGPILLSQPSLKKTLTELALEHPEVPIPDIEKFVKRGVDERKVKGRVIRPLTAFILYRKAYLDLARVAFGMPHLQDATRIVGASWRLEGLDVRKRWCALSEEDFARHFALFPGYRFKVRKRIDY